MKSLKMVLLLWGMICLVVSVTNAATVTSYTASASPGDALDGNGNSVDVWTVTGDGGASRSFLQGYQDGNSNMWAIWDLNGGGGTYATHTFAGGALKVGQTVSIDWAHNRNIETPRQIGIRFLDGSSNQVALVFQGGKLVFSRYDTATGIYTDTVKYYDRYDIFQVVFTLTGSDAYTMSVTEGSIADNPTGLGNNADDGNANVGNVVDFWTGNFTGSAITGIQVYTEGGNDSDQWFDNLVINDDWINKPHNQLPSREQKDVIVSGLELSWGIPQVYSQANPELLIADPNLLSFNLRYSDTDPNLDAAAPISITAWNTGTLRASYVPSPALNKNATYYWRVDSVMDYGVVKGREWVFYTELTRAIIQSGPAYQIVDAGSTAVFSVVVDSVSPATYYWYKYVDGISDIMLTDGGDISGAATDTLSIANVEAADEGQYYCIVNNDSGIGVASEMAPLGMKRKIAYWPFDGGVLDSTIPGSPASVVVGDPNIASESILGGAMEFDNDVDMLYTDPEQTSYFDICDYEMTVACWVKTTDNQSWCALVARNGEGQGWALRQSGFTGNRSCFTTRGTGSEDGTPANRTIYDGQWHYIAATFDGTVKKIYIDGVVSRLYSADNGSLIRQSDDVTSPIRKSLSPVAIAGRVGGNAAEGLDIQTGNIVGGIYDEVEIYNYALDAATIAQTYADLSGTNVCLTQTYDLDNDCVVNLNDLGLLASEWLNNQLFEPAP
jgi:hypothetical protein